MKLQEAPSSINKVVKFPSSVTSYLKSGDAFDEKCYDLNGGLLKDTHYAWLSCGPNFKVIRTSNGAKVAAWTFGAVLRDSKTRVTCVAELPSNDGSGRVSQFVVGLECELVGGMICVFDIRGSRVLRAIQLPSKVVCMSVVDSGTGGCSPLPQILSSMTGVLAVGLAGGEVLLMDLCRCSYDEGIGAVPTSELRDEVYACQLLLVNVRETDPEMLELKRTHAARSGDHLCVVLNESFLSDRMFLLPLPDGDPVSISRRRVDVTALMYIPRIASVVIGFNFGSFQIWNLMNLSLEYMSPAMQDPLPIVSFGFQEPCDDPRNHCYLWTVHSTKSGHRQLPFAVMYALCYQNKEWVDGYGYLNQEFESCLQQFDFDMDEDDSGTPMVGGCSIACHTVNKVLPGPAAAKRDNPRADLDESIQENDLTLCLFVWETWGVNGTGSSQMALFDLNQWYKEQMPSKIIKGHASTYMTIFSLDDVVEGTLNGGNPLLDVRVDPASISQFTAVQSLEEHYYPSALAFESLSLLGEELVMVNHPGVQRDILSQLEQNGPNALLHPTKLFHHCIAIGLKPMYTEISSTNCLVTEQREFVLSVALEHQLVRFLSRCASEWMDGSQSATGCTLAGLLKWGWQRANTLKTHADTLCIPLYDHSGERLDSNSYQLLHYCGNQMHHLTTLFQGVLKVCKNPHIKGVGDIAEQARVLELVAVYIEVVEWFVNVGLLPEFPCAQFSLTNNEYDDLEPHKVPYPVSALANIYKNRREDLERLSRSAADKTDVLFIDGLVKRECNGDRLSSLWERDGGTGLYPPPSIQSLLRIYLLDGIPMHVKHCIVIYVFLDLAGLLESQRYADTINQFIKFPSAFRLTPSFIKITQALWLLDHQDFMEAIDMLLDPLVSMNDLKPWQHQCIIRAFLYQGQHQMALKYVQVQQPPLKDIEDIRLNLTVLLVNGLIHEAFQYQRQHCNEQNSRDLLQHFFSACQQMNQLSVVLQLALSPAEEDAFSQFLQNCQNPQADDMRVMYYLERSRIAEAMEVNDSIRSSRSHIEMSCLKRSRSDDKPTCVRDTIVQAYANTLPSVTRKLAQYCAQEKLKAFTWKQVSRPTPMSVAVHRGESQPVRYRSSLIQATLEKARETWSHLLQRPSSPCTPGKRDRSSMEKSSVEMTPFLCTPRSASQIAGIQRDITDVVFPTLTYPSPKTDDEVLGGSPVKRFRYSEHYPTSLGSSSPLQRKRLDRYSSVDALSLLQTPHVRRRSSSVSRQQQSDVTMFTPHSILKVRKLVRRSASPDNVSIPSFTSTSTTPDLPAGEEEQVDEQMQVSDEEVPTGRQIRFSFPMVQEEREKSKTPDVEEAAGPVTRSATKRSLLGGTPRKALTRTRRSPVAEKSMDTNSDTSFSWTVKDKLTLETKPSKEDDDESTSVDNDSDAFHSLENSGSGLLDNVESPMKKQRVDSPDRDLEEQTHHNTVGKRVVKETYVSFKTTETVQTTVHDDSEDVDIHSQKTESQTSLLVVETSKGKSFEKNSEDDEDAELDTSMEVQDKPEVIVSDNKEPRKVVFIEDTSYHGSSFDMICEDKEELQEILVNGKEYRDNSDAHKALVTQREEYKGILPEDSTYHGLSFEISCETVADETEQKVRSDVEEEVVETSPLSGKDSQDGSSDAHKGLVTRREEYKGILPEDSTYHGSSFEISCETVADETEEKVRSDGEEEVVETLALSGKDSQDGSSDAHRALVTQREEYKGILPEDSTYHSSSFEISCETVADETEEKVRSDGEEEVVETSKPEERSPDVEEDSTDRLISSQDIATRNGDEQAYADYCNGAYNMEDNGVLPALIIESVTGNAEVCLSSEEDHEYQTLQSAAVVMPEEKIDVEVASKLPDVLLTGERDSEEEENDIQEEEENSEEEMEEDEEEEERQAARWISQSDDEASVVVLDSDSEDVPTKSLGVAMTRVSNKEESEEEEQNEEEEEEEENEFDDEEVEEEEEYEEEIEEDEEEEEEQEIESECEIEHKSDESIDEHSPSEKEAVVEHNVSDDKLSTSDNGEVDSDAGDEAEVGDQSKVKSVTVDDDNIPQNVEECNTSEDSLRETVDFIFEDCSSESSNGSPFQNVAVEESDTSNDTPYLSEQIVTIEEREISPSQMSQVAAKASAEGSESQEITITVDLSGKLNSSKDVSQSDVTHDDDKERMDFEECISFNEISKSGQSQLREGQISQAMDIDKDEAMDFEVEITASQITKPGTTDNISEPNASDSLTTCTENDVPSLQVESSEKMEVQEMVDKTLDTRTSKTDEARDNSSILALKSKPLESRRRSGSVPPDNAGANQSKLNRSLRGTSAPPEDISDSNKRKSGHSSVKVENMQLTHKENPGQKIHGSDVRTEDLQVIEEEPHTFRVEEKNEADVSFCRTPQTRAGSLPPSDSLRSKIRKSRRSSSLQPEDSISKNSCVKSENFSLEHSKRKVHKPESISGSVQPENILMLDTEKKTQSVPLEDILVVRMQKKLQKAGSRADSIPLEDIPVVDTEKKLQNVGSKPSSILPVDIPMVDSEKKCQKAGSRSGSIPSQDIPMVDLESKPQKARSVPPEDVPLIDTKKTHQKAGIRDGSFPSEDISMLAAVKKSQRSGSRAGSVPLEDIPVLDAEKKIQKAGSRAGSIPPEDISMEDAEKKIQKAGSVPPEDITTIAVEKKARKAGRRAGSVPPEDIPAIAVEKKSGSRARSVPPEDSPSIAIEKEAGKAGSRSGSVPPEDIPTIAVERKAGSRAGSVPPEDIPAIAVEKKAGSRAGTVLPEGIAAVFVEKKTGKAGSRAGSVPPEDFLAISVEKNTGKAGSRAGSVPPEDIPTIAVEKKAGSRAGTVLPEGIAAVSVEKKTGKAGSRAGSVPPEDIPAISVEKKTGKAGSRAGSVPPEDILAISVDKKTGKAGSRAGSVRPEDIPAISVEKKTGSRSGSVPPEDISAISVEKKTGKAGSRAGSVPPEDISAISVVKKTGKVGSRAGSVPPEDSPAIYVEKIAENRAGSVPPEDISAISIEKKTGKAGIRAGSVPPEDIRVVAVENKPRKARSVPPEDIPVVDAKKKPQKGGSRTGSLPRENIPMIDADKKSRLVLPEEIPVVDAENKPQKAGSVSPENVSVINAEKENQKAGSVLPEDVPMVDVEKKLRKAGSVLSEDIRVVDAEQKPQKARSLPLEDVPMVDAERRTQSIDPDRPSSQASTVSHEDAAGVCNRQQRALSLSSQASTVHLKPSRSRRSSISSQASSMQEDVRLDVVYEEPEDVEGGNSGRSGALVKNRRLSGDFDLRLPSSVRRTRSESGSVHGMPTGCLRRKTVSEVGSVIDQSFVRTLRSGKVISESEEDVSSPKSGVRRRARADSTTGEDAVKVMEEYATARRLTRHQRSLLERSLELAKATQPSRSYRLPALPETSDDEESESSSIGTRSSSRLSARNAPASPTTSQASTLHIDTSDNSPPKTPRRSRRSLSRLNDITADSPSSVKSDASTVYASSVTSVASPSSTRSEDVIGSRMRRRSFQKAQQAFKSMSEKSYPIGSKMSSPTESEVSSETSCGIFARSAVVRLSRLQEDDLDTLSSFQFSPPTTVPGAGKKEVPTSSVPAFVFSPPQKQQPHPKPHRSPVTSQRTRVHTMALRGLHTITEETLTSSPSTPASSREPKSSDRDTTPIAVKRSKRFKSTPKTASARISIMTPLNEEEKRELAERERTARQSRQPAQTRRYTAFKQRKVMRLLKSRSSKSQP